VFLGIREVIVRSIVESRLLIVEVLIPSLFMLFKDLRYLEPIVKAVKALLPSIVKGSLKQSLRHIFPKYIYSLKI
jgi:hypothetical protein